MTERRATWMIVVGVVLILAGAIGAVTLWFGAEARLDDNVASFARAPVGCDTTLDFTSTGEFLLFVETRGRIDGVDGDCDAARDYDRSRSASPDLLLVDRGGAELRLRPAGDVEYDRDGFAGTAFRRVEVARTGRHVLTVGEVDGEAFVVAVGREPSRGVAPLRWGAISSLVVGLVGGAAFLLIGSRRAPAAAVPAAVPGAWVPGVPPAGWPQAPSWPAGPPTAPPNPPLTAQQPADRPAWQTWPSVPESPGAQPPSVPPVVRPPGEPAAGPWGPPQL